QGEAMAQHNLGFMHENGLGTPSDDVQAVNWYRLSAGVGSVVAQKNLGRMYFQGKGVPIDNLRAYAWLNLAAIGGDSDAVEQRAMVEQSMDAAQVAEAQVLSTEIFERIQAGNFVQGE
ncbi:MAG: tetratricopeptide repeat protein, partial [Pseudomonadota bacterium]|nr:tetratricopeptide repeat protein [Pseudomonadota bacterium]